MPAFYTYLISTLPALSFGARPPFSFGQFIDYCQRFIPDKDIRVLGKASIAGEYEIEEAHPMLKQWGEFDTTLRNELAKIRASRKRVDPAKYLRKDRFAEAHITHLALDAHRSPSILDAEKLLDQARWQALDEFCFGHYFDLDFLIIYALKLLLLERWERVNTVDRNKILEEVLL